MYTNKNVFNIFASKTKILDELWPSVSKRDICFNWPAVKCVRLRYGKLSKRNAAKSDEVPKRVDAATIRTRLGRGMHLDTFSSGFNIFFFYFVYNLTRKNDWKICYRVIELTASLFPSAFPVKPISNPFRNRLEHTKSLCEPYSPRMVQLNSRTTNTNGTHVYGTAIPAGLNDCF